MEKLPHRYFSRIVCFQKIDTYARCFLWRQNNPELNTPQFGSPGAVFQGKYPAAGAAVRRITKKRRRNSTATRLERGMKEP